MFTQILPVFSFARCCLLLAALWAGAVQAAPNILVTGDSLSAAYGIPLEKGWVALMQARLQEEGYPHRLVNTSISGETTSGGLARLEKELEKHQPGIVVLELGANDGLRGLSLDDMRANLGRMIDLSQAAGAKVLVLGMRLPSNYGPAYTGEFHDSFRQVAEKKKTALVPFFMEAIALDEKWFQADGIHPTAEAQPLLLDTVWPVIEPLLMAQK